MGESAPQEGKRPSSTVSPSSSRPGMVSARSPGWRNSLYSNVPANRDAGDQKIPAGRSATQPAAALSGLGGHAAPPATRRRRRTAFSSRAIPQSGLPPSRLECPGKSVRSGHTWASAGSLQPAPRGPSFLPPLPLSLPDWATDPSGSWPRGMGGEAEAEPSGWVAQGGNEASFRKSVHRVAAGHSLLGRLQGAV